LDPVLVDGPGQPLRVDIPVARPKAEPVDDGVLIVLELDPPCIESCQFLAKSAQVLFVLAEQRLYFTLQGLALAPKGVLESREALVKRTVLDGHPVFGLSHCTLDHQSLHSQLVDGFLPQDFSRILAQQSLLDRFPSLTFVLLFLVSR
jgi:hypothetical protein